MQNYTFLKVIRLWFFFLSLLVSINVAAQNNCQNFLATPETSLLFLGEKKKFSLNSKSYTIVERQRSIVSIKKSIQKKLLLNSEHVYGNLELSPGEYWAGEVNPSNIEDVKLLVEPRLVEGLEAGHAMLWVRFQNPVKFHMQRNLKVKKSVQDLVFSINPQVVLQDEVTKPAPFRFIRYRIMSKEEIIRKYKKNDPHGDVAAHSLFYSKKENEALVSFWLKQAVEKGESDLFDYYCNNCATNLHEVFKETFPPHSLFEKLLWGVTGLHFLGGNEGGAFPKTLRLRNLLRPGGFEHVFFEKELK